VKSCGEAKLKTFKPKNPEVGKWKVNESSGARSTFKPKPTFDQLLSKYVNEKANQKHKDWPGDLKRQRSPPRMLPHSPPKGPQKQELQQQ
jgi:hypothetical protein